MQKSVSIDKNQKITYPDSISIGTIGVNQTKLVHFPIKALKNIPDGSIPVRCFNFSFFE